MGRLTGVETFGWTVAFCLLTTAAPAQDQQVGARTKAMGGSYTAFEDDPVSVWLNPAGIATQPDQAAVAFQTYTGYPLDLDLGPNDTKIGTVAPKTIVVSPVVIPSYLGMVFQVGDEENPMALGVCYVRPYHLDYALDEVLNPTQSSFVPEAGVEQSFSRIRVAGAYDFRIRKSGEPGFLTHVAVGLGVDGGFENWEFSQTSGDSEESSWSVGFGAGILVGLYDNGESFKVNFGSAYQSSIRFDFEIDPALLPAFDMPQQLNIGSTFYLLRETPLRLTMDLQWIDWSETAQKPTFSGHPTFRDSVNVSIGGEYRVRVSPKVYLYPRLGYRRFQAPWDDPNRLPMMAGFKLVLDTKDEAFHILTFGLGISWLTEEKKLRSIDLAGDFGGDSANAAIGYTHEF